jgi:hypothetical protein
MAEFSYDWRALIVRSKTSKHLQVKREGFDIKIIILAFLDLVRLIKNQIMTYIQIERNLIKKPK